MPVWLAVSDCSQVADDVEVVILASGQFLKERGIKERGMYFFINQTVLDAYERSGLSIEDIDGSVTMNYLYVMGKES